MERRTMPKVEDDSTPPDQRPPPFLRDLHEEYNENTLAARGCLAGFIGAPVSPKSN